MVCNTGSSGAAGAGVFVASGVFIFRMCVIKEVETHDNGTENKWIVDSTYIGCCPA